MFDGSEMKRIRIFNYVPEVEAFTTRGRLWAHHDFGCMLHEERITEATTREQATERGAADAWRDCLTRSSDGSS